MGNAAQKKNLKLNGHCWITRREKNRKVQHAVDVNWLPIGLVAVPAAPVVPASDAGNKQPLKWAGRLEKKVVAAMSVARIHPGIPGASANKVVAEVVTGAEVEKTGALAEAAAALAAVMADADKHLGVRVRCQLQPRFHLRMHIFQTHFLLCLQHRFQKTSLHHCRQGRHHQPQTKWCLLRCLLRCLITAIGEALILTPNDLFLWVIAA